MKLVLLALLLTTSEPKPVEFSYVAEEKVSRANLAGTFNGWNKVATPMKLGPDGRTWTVSVPLAPGKYYYKFVLDGERWITDPKALRDEDDGNGNMNSVLIVYPADYSKPAKRGDANITLGAIRHLQRVPDLNVDKGRLTMTLTVRPGDIERIALAVEGRSPVPMELLSADEIEEVWRGSVPFSSGLKLAYSFELRDGSLVRFYGPKGPTATAAENRFVLEPGTFRPFVVPAWVEKTVFYQIFPDRFENGDTSNDPKTVQAWNAEPTYYNRFGGDIAGVTKRMGHLQELGVGGVYFNPVMKAPSNHRYDPVDFYVIDPEFGTNAEFAQMMRDLERAGIRTVLDQIFDHVGVTFPPFADLLEQQEKSAYKDWFFVKKFPVKVEENPNYEAWWGAQSMPKINLRNPDAYKYLMDSVDFWHEKVKLAGWRLDVANEVPDFFWQDFRKRVKKLEPDAWIVGEVWGDARHWLRGDMWDASMNYPFRDAVLRFVAEGRTKPSQFLDQLMTVYGWYAPQVSRNQMNLLSSHDTPRFLTLCNGDRRLAKLGAAIQMAWVGAPSIYYGEEIGMEGGADPQNRRAMRWDLATAENDMLALYRKLIAARNASRALQSGDPTALWSDDQNNVAAFSRVDGNDVATLIVNRSSIAQKVSVPTPAKSALVDAIDGAKVSPKSGRLDLELPPLGFRLLITPTPKDKLSRHHPFPKEHL